MRWLALSAVLILVGPPPAGGQDIPAVIEELRADSRVQAALQYLLRIEEDTITDQISLCEIPAPPFLEQDRATAFQDRLRDLGLENVRIDSEGNAIGERPGVRKAPVLLLVAHLDTVFPAGTDVRVSRHGDLLRGPGIGDNCRGLAVVLAVVKAMNEASIGTEGSLIVAGTVGEEGRGNLRGVRHLLTREFVDRIDLFLSVDGPGFELTKDAVGSHRYSVTFKGPGGHSYSDFGDPSPIHGMGRAIAAIAEIPVPDDPRTTFNVGLAEGGTSINSIAQGATILVDLRSVDRSELAELDQRFRQAVRGAVAAENEGRRAARAISVTIEDVGMRPAGSQPADAPIVQFGVASGLALGFEPVLEAASTDANLPISLGIPAVTMDGGGKGDRSHSTEEVFDSRDSHLGPQWALLYILGLIGIR